MIILPGLKPCFPHDTPVALPRTTTATPSLAPTITPTAALPPSSPLPSLLQIPLPLTPQLTHQLSHSFGSRVGRVELLRGSSLIPFFFPIPEEVRKNFLEEDREYIKWEVNRASIGEKIEDFDNKCEDLYHKVRTFRFFVLSTTVPRTM
jgi:hypothetical protein